MRSMCDVAVSRAGAAAPAGAILAVLDHGRPPIGHRTGLFDGTAGVPAVPGLTRREVDRVPVRC
jgi:hypothetical protein